MRHAVLGMGGVGGLVGGALARVGADVVFLLREETLQQYTGELEVESKVLGDFTVTVPAVTALDRPVDVVWIAPKATQLASALSLAPATQVGDATVVPLMNGVDHVAVLRSRYPRVLAGAIRVASERVRVGSIRQVSAFLRIDLVGDERLAAEVRSAGIECHLCDDEITLLWQKLVFLAPLALATTALDGPLGAVRGSDRFLRCQDECLAVAEAEGARIDLVALRTLLESAPDTMRSSMQLDVENNLAPELDAIAGPIVRGGLRHDISTPATESLVDRVSDRIHRAGASRNVT